MVCGEPGYPGFFMPSHGRFALCGGISIQEVSMGRNDLYQNEDGTLKCFGKAQEWTDPETGASEFHCAHAEAEGNCNEQIRKECWKHSSQEGGEHMSSLEDRAIYAVTKLRFLQEVCQTPDLFDSPLHTTKQSLLPGLGLILGEIADQLDREEEKTERG